MTDVQTQEWLRWGLGGVGAAAIFYARYTHGQLKEERAAREAAAAALSERVTAVEIQAAASARDSETLEKVRDRLETLAGVVYQIAGHLGISTKG